jgi:hypothetical protein
MNRPDLDTWAAGAEVLSSIAAARCRQRRELPSRDKAREGV